MTCDTKRQLTAKQLFYMVVGSTTTMNKVGIDNLWHRLEEAGLKVELKGERE